MYGPTFGSLVMYIISIINNTIVPLIFAVTFLVFIYGVFRFFILGSADSTSRESGKQFIIWGMIGMAVMVSVWGIIYMVVNTFGLQNFRSF